MNIQANAFHGRPTCLLLFGYHANAESLRIKERSTSSAASLDAIFLRVLPSIIYAAPVYAMAKLQGSLEHAALFVCVTTVFSIVIGALSMAITVGEYQKLPECKNA